MEASYDILAMGVAAVDDLLYVPQYPPANTKIPISRSARHPGGLATTAAAAAARLGGRAAYLARFDKSDLSAYMVSTLTEVGVDVSHIIADPAREGGQPFHSTIIVDNSGARTILYDASGFRPLAAADLPAELMRSAGVCFIDYIQDPPAIELAKKIRAAGVPIVGDIEGRSSNALHLLPLVDHLIVSEEFAAWASGSSDLPAACSQLAQMPRRATIVTAGPHGCYLCTAPDNPPLHIPAFKVDAVDTTGCGDTFHGAFALAIARRFTLQDAAIFASAAAAIKATGRAGWKSIPTAADVLAFVESRRDYAQPSHSVVTSIRSLIPHS